MEDRLARDGFAMVPGVLDAGRVAALIEELAPMLREGGGARSTRAGSVYGVRNLLGVPAVHDLARDPAVLAIVTPALGPDPRPVRAILFDNTPGANWHVPWHQDLSIAVRERPAADPPGWGPWSVKAGVVHVQPPAAVLGAMLTVRLHLDPCPAENGALRVLPGTHRLGRLSAADIARLRRDTPEHVGACGAGAALLMRPLLLHASGEASARTVAHRRVVHIEYAAAGMDLPAGLTWHEEG
jgi:ectoine hydroxylase-related dioxygenase (phytanoyl-CoA dioxygenase family)